jgi:hypothetical protein
MASAWLERRSTASGVRFRVRYRLGGRESIPRFAGSFETKREALARRAWVMGELAAMRVPDLALVDLAGSSPTLRDQAERWRASRVDVSPGRAQTYMVAINRLDGRLGDTAIDKIKAQTVADLVPRCRPRSRF